MAAPLCFIDTETDGVHPDRRVWEVAMIRRDGSGTKDRSFFVEIDLSTADPFGLKVGRFYDRHPRGRILSGAGSAHAGDTLLSEQDAALEVAKMTHGAHLVGAVPNFDAEVLARLLRDYGLTPAWHYHLVDVEALAVGYLWGLAKPGSDPLPKPPWDSESVSSACGVQPPGEDIRHTALGDAIWAMSIYDRIVKYL